MSDSWERPTEQLERIVDAMADPLFVKDAQHRWVLVNEAFCAFMGQRREAILGRSDFDFFPRSEAETFWAKDEEVFRSGGVNVNEEPLTDADGKTRTIITKKTVFTDSSGRRMLVGTIRDITELKLAQEELRRAHDELELRVEQRTREYEDSQTHLHQAQKMEAVGQLTGGIAHDFNNLLAVIVGNLELAQQEVDEGSELSDLIELALAAAGRGSSLTQRLLTFSRRQLLQPRPIDVVARLEDIAGLLRRALGAEIVLDLTAEPGVGCSELDLAQFEGALLNLAINARDAMGGAGRLRIDTSRVTVEIRDAEHFDLEPGPYVLVEVTDDGSGMSADTLQRVFEPFFSTKEDGRGSGLGLSMVYGFVKQSHGDVAISSSVDRGTTVKLFLPVCEGPVEESAEASPVADDAVAMGCGETVLVVDDDVGVRNMLVMLLRGLGYRVLGAASAKEALELERVAGELDLLLTDVVLGKGGRGPQLAEELRRRRAGLRVLLMTGYHAGFVAGARDGLLDKPFRRAQLARAVKNALQADTDLA